MKYRTNRLWVRSLNKKITKNQIIFLDHITDAKSLELLYQLVNRATSMVSLYTTRIKDEQTFRHALTKTMKVAHIEQTAIVSRTRF